MSLPEAIAYLRQQADAPAQLRTAEWDRVPVDVRERAFFMAGVDDAETLQLFRDQAEKIAAGEQTTGGARLAIRDELERRGYRPEPGTKGTIKDLSTVRRQNVALETNVRQARGYGAWQRQQAALKTFPAWEYYRGQQRMEPRDWRARWARARSATLEAGATDPYAGQGMVALVNHPLWSDPDFNRFGTPYPPFDFLSGMTVAPVSRSRARELGLLPEQHQGETRDILESMMKPQTRGLNDGLEARPAVDDDDLREALAQHLDGIAEWDGDTLRFLPAGSRPRPVTVPERTPEPTPAAIVPPADREAAVRDVAERLFPSSTTTYTDAGVGKPVVNVSAPDMSLDFYLPNPSLPDDSLYVAWMSSSARDSRALRGIDALADIAERTGASEITTGASRGDGMNGYRMWPKLGFDGPIPDNVRAQLPPDLAHHRSVLDLYLSPSGRRWWIENGDSYLASFDLAPDSRSRRVLADLKSRLDRRNRT